MNLQNAFDTTTGRRARKPSLSSPELKLWTIVDQANRSQVSSCCVDTRGLKSEVVDVSVRGSAALFLILRTITTDARLRFSAFWPPKIEDG